MADAVIPANKVINLLVPMDGTDKVVWTPAAGKRIRLLGWSFGATVIAGNVIVKNGAGGTSLAFINVPAVPALIQTPMGFGNGVVLDKDTPLVLNGTNTMSVIGFLCGCEE